MGFEIIRKKREFLGMKSADLARKIGCTPQIISKFELGQQKLTDVWIKKFSQALDIPAHYFIEDSSKFDLHKNTIRINERLITTPDLVPAYDRHADFPGAIDMRIDREVKKVPRSYAQVGEQGAFAAYAPDTTMSPRHEIGERVAVIENLAPKEGQDCIVQLWDGRGYLKKFVRIDDKEVICEQLKPKKECRWKRADVKAVHSVVR